ncbi:MAG: Do family serine endopeptidase [Prevotellaceae bacterium]|jgi:Do/DeqQ family serine protease|nr:Do family serine endopeptidase [Prevotellaceae bacterium]
MNSQKGWKNLGLIVAVALVSIFTTIATSNYLSKDKNIISNNAGQEVVIPAAYANFSRVSSATDTDFTLAAELSVNAVVHVKVKTPVATRQLGFSDPFFEYFFGRPRQPQNSPQEIPMQEGSGSGVIITNDGYVVTNNHVIDRSAEIEVTLNDKRTFKATLVGADPSTDIALLKIDADDLSVIPFGDSDAMKVGEWVLAVGNPFNLTSTVTAGIISAKARNINILSAEMKIESFIQTDAAVNPGNSGGALVNTRGELIGINTAIASQTGSYAGYAFAVPSNIVSKVVTDLRKYGVVQRAILGVEIRDISNEFMKEKDLKTLNGAYVNKVVEKSAAEAAGVKEGDIINNVNGTVVKSVAELQEQVGRHRPGDKITVTVLRNNKPVTLNVQLKNFDGNTDIVSAPKTADVLGATFKELDKKVTEKFYLDYGLQIESLKNGKFQDAGIKEGYIVLKINDQSIRTQRDVQSVIEQLYNRRDRDKVLYIAGIYPDGRRHYYAVKLAD